MRALLHSALGGDVRLEMVLAPELWPAMIDATQIELLILNLAINARDAMPAGGTVTLQAKNVRHTRHGCPDDLPLGDYVLLTVTDTGTGMTPSVKARAFEPFFTTKAPGSGSGLGLSQVFGTARQLGGSVAIRTALGQGTTISVFLPRAQVAVSPVSAPRVRPVRPAQDGGVAVLLVDDDDAVRMVIATMLRDLGYAVREAASGAEALTILQQDIGVDVVLTDIAMLGMTGVELADAAQALLPELAVVYMSGYAEIPSGTNGAHPRRLLSKPFRPGELREQIEAALAERHVPVD
jgi:CheY-like chemotaxis protein